jgi:hypothetical protein
LAVPTGVISLILAGLTDTLGFSPLCLPCATYCILSVIALCWISLSPDRHSAHRLLPPWKMQGLHHHSLNCSLHLHVAHVDCAVAVSTALNAMRICVLRWKQNLSSSSVQWLCMVHKKALQHTVPGSHNTGDYRHRAACSHTPQCG